MARVSRCASEEVPEWGLRARCVFKASTGNVNYVKTIGAYRFS